MSNIFSDPEYNKALEKLKASKKHIENLTQAVAFFVTRYGGRFARAENGAKGPVCIVLHDGMWGLAYLFFKRGWLHSYGKLFPQEEWQGWGQTTNFQLLKKAANEGAIIVVAMPDAEFYACDALEWLSYAIEHNTVRRPTEETGLEASVPAKMLKRVPEVPA